MSDNSAFSEDTELSKYLVPFFDPLTKLILLLTLLFVSLYSNNILVVTSSVIISLIIDFLPNKAYKRILRGIIIGLTISVVSTLLLWILNVVNQPFFAFGIISGRFLTAIFSVEWFFTTVSPYEFAEVLERLHFPNTIIWMIMLIHQQIPLLSQEAHRINDVRKLRGLTAHFWQIKRAIHIMRLLLSPLIVSAINQSVDYAQAMLIKGFDFKRRKERFLEYKLRIQDYITIVVVLGYSTLSVIMRQKGWLSYLTW